MEGDPGRDLNTNLRGIPQISSPHFPKKKMRQGITILDERGRFGDGLRHGSQRGEA
jgi:hypothetical protein